MVESVIEMGLFDVFDYRCLEAAIVPKILALGLICILFRYITSLLQVEHHTDVLPD
jgi:hypothetical protein